MFKKIIMKKILPILSGLILTCASLNAQTTVFEENFNSSASMPSSIEVVNYNNDGTTFEFQQSGGVNNSKCAGIGYAYPENFDAIRVYNTIYEAGKTYTLTFSHKAASSIYTEKFFCGFWNSNSSVWGEVSAVQYTNDTSFQEVTLSYTPSSNHYGYVNITNKSEDEFGWYVDDISITVTVPSAISVVTSPASQISKNSAVSGGTITNPNNEVIETVAILWLDLGTSNVEVASQNYQQDSYSINMPNLIEDTDYAVRAWLITENEDTIYGSVEYFTTLDPCANDDEVFLSNLAFIDESTAASFGTYFIDYELPGTLNYDALNPNNFLNPGLPVSFKVQCSNQKENGNAIVSGECRLRTSDSQITILDSISGLNNVGWGSTAWSTDEFKIQVSSSVTESFTAYVDFVVIENGEEYVTKCIPIPVKSFSMNQNSIDDDANPDSDGDGDGIVEPGERIETLPTIDNESEFQSSLVAGFLRNLKSYSGIEILNDVQGSSGTIYSQGWYNVSFGSPAPMEAGQINAAPEYDFVFDYDMDETYSFQLDLIVAGGFYLFGDTLGATLIRQSTPIYYNSTYPAAVTGIQDNLDKSSNVSIYPNPTNGKISISSEDGQFGSSEVQVFSSIGQIVLSKNDVIIGNNPTEIDLSALPKGVYTLVIAGEGAMSQNQIVVD